MDNYFIVGNVISIKGVNVEILMNSNTNTLTYFHDGKTYRGITIGEYVGIIRGPYKIIGKVESEFLTDKINDISDQSYILNRFKRIIIIKIIGYFYKQEFHFGIKFLPMIFNEVILLTDEEKESIINRGLNTKSENFTIEFGKSIQDDLTIKLPINGLFNSHIGVFGNTGSGKSNTLSKLYTELFHHNELSVVPNSKFIFLDFNGEYIGKEMFSTENKKIIKLSTRNPNSDKIKMKPKNFWNKETLSILFSATEKTQQPFISNMLSFYIDNNDISIESLKKGTIQSYKNVFEGNNNKESLNLLKKIFNILKLDYDKIPLANALWNSTTTSYYEGGRYLSSVELSIDEIEQFKSLITDNLFNSITIIDKLILLINFQLIYSLRYNNVQFEHINPLLTRVEAYRNFINNTIEITNEEDNSNIIVISLKDCNLDAKKIIPLLISKQLYQEHIEKCKDDEEIKNTCHLIIDEAHNILSEQSIREAESFKDYRLEVFEQIIKEGRKYGFYLTISSQRPYDISPTIISQINNYFIHRLINELDLKMLSNTISTLDTNSKDMIPNLAPGQCVITGNLFELPMIVQVDKLRKSISPKSDNADIIFLWRKQI